MLIAHTYSKKQINDFIENPKHALGISGLTGSGKGYVAQFISAEILDTNIEKLSAHPYYMKLDALGDKSGIDEIREIQKFLHLTVPGNNTLKRVVVIENFDALGHEAQNSSLKMLEEPPADTLIIITFVNRNKVLSTIHSRVQEIRNLPVEYELINDSLKTEFSESEIKKAHLISGGLVGLCISILKNDDHPLLSSINKAKTLLSLNKYERISGVDRAIKDKETSPELLLEGIFRLLNASYQVNVKSSEYTKTKNLVSRLQLVENSINDLNEKVSTKLVLSRLMLEL